MAVLTAATLLAGCGDDDIKRRYDGTFTMDARISGQEHHLEGPVDVGFYVYTGNQALLAVNSQLCSIQGTYVGDVTEPDANGKENTYELVRDLRPDQILVCPVPPGLPEDLHIEFRLGTGRIDDGTLTYALEGNVWRESSPALADAQGELVGTFTYEFTGKEVEVR